YLNTRSRGPFLPYGPSHDSVLPFSADLQVVVLCRRAAVRASVDHGQAQAWSVQVLTSGPPPGASLLFSDLRQRWPNESLQGKFPEFSDDWGPNKCGPR